MWPEQHEGFYTVQETNMNDVATATSILCYHVSEWNHDRIKHQAVLDSVDEW